MDLHILHPMGTWFSAPRDCYYANPNPDWGIPLEPADDPSLMIDDTDGAGPESVRLNLPEENTIYRVGVDYYSDYGYGESLVSVQIFIWGVLRYEYVNKQMPASKFFWQVANIHGAGGEIEELDILTEGPPDG